MVSSPVADLLAPKSHESYIEYKNAAGDTIRFNTFTKDHVKMVSLNGIEISLDELFDIIQDMDIGTDLVHKEENEYHIILPCILTVACFLAIMLYMHYALSMAFR